MGEGLQVGASEARRILRAVIADGVLHFSGHARREMAKDGMTDQDIVNTLRAGLPEPSEFENGSWRHRVKTNRFCVVVTLLSEREAVVVTAWRVRGSR